MIESSHVDDSAIARINDEVSVGEDLQFQRAWWKFERAIWIFFVVIIALDVAGLFGRGPLANARISSDDQSFEVAFERIQRTGTPSLMTISFYESAIHNGQVEVFVSDSIVSQLGAQRVIPQPQSTRITSGGLTYTFPARSPGTVRLELRPDSAGVYGYEIRTGGGGAIQAKVWVMP